MFNINCAACTVANMQKMRLRQAFSLLEVDVRYKSCPGGEPTNLEIWEKIKDKSPLPFPFDEFSLPNRAYMMALFVRFCSDDPHFDKNWVKPKKPKVDLNGQMFLDNSDGFFNAYRPLGPNSKKKKSTAILKKLATEKPMSRQ